MPIIGSTPENPQPNPHPDPNSDDIREPYSGDYGEPANDPEDETSQESEWEQMKADVNFLLSLVGDRPDLTNEQRSRIGNLRDEQVAQRAETDKEEED